MKPQIRRPKRKNSGQQNAGNPAPPPTQNGEPKPNNVLQQAMQNIYNKILDLEKATRTKMKPSENKKIYEELEVLKKQYENEVAKLQQENDKYKKDAEINRMADEKLQQEKRTADIKSRVDLMIEKGAIASGDTESIKHWTTLYESNYDTTDKIVAIELEKLNAGNPQNGAITPPPQQSIKDIGNQMAAKYFTGDSEVFDAKIKN